MRRQGAAVAAIAMLCAASWMALNVAGNYGGHVSGLFYTGSKSPLPAEVAAHTYRVRDDAGYDAQFYHLVAHDPLMRRGFAAFVDNPPLRWRRIGVPGLAAIVAFGSDRAVDHIYIAIQLVFVFLGAFWLAQYAQSEKRRAVWGLAFLFIPAVAVSIDRMTVDLALAALTIGLVYYSAFDRLRWQVYPILCAAPLVRETGMVLIAAWCIRSALKRNWRAAALGAACAFPALGWWVYISRHTAPDGTAWLSSYPFSGLIERTVQGIDAPVSTLWLRAAWLFENLALAGIWLALTLSFYLVWRRRFGFMELSAIAFTAFASTLGKFDIWESAYATGRTMSPLLIVLGLISVRDRKPVFAIPLLLIIPRIALQYEAQLMGALRRIL
ncbi:MAG TPA: hypothetical protein VN428_06380 [Bryobacteraceae bacterium]|nr:hypothetical protein [Bryobacteraceae bacterium]